MKTIPIDLEVMPSVFYADFLPSVFGEGGMRLSDALVRSLVIYKSGFDRRRKIVGDAAIVKNIPAESISASLGVSLYDVRRVLREIGDTIDISPARGKYFPLLVGVESDVVKNERTSEVVPVRGLAMVVYSYLVNKCRHKRGALADVPILDVWVSTLAEEMRVSESSLSRQLWKLESIGLVYRFYGVGRKPYMWINETPLTPSESEAVIVKTFMG